MSTSRALAALRAILVACTVAALMAPSLVQADPAEPAPPADAPLVSVGAVQLAPTYARGVLGRLHVAVRAREGRTITLAFAAPQVAVRAIGCQAPADAACAIDSSGQVRVSDDGDDVVDEVVELDIEASVIPQRAIGLTSVEGAGFTPAERVVSITATEDGAPPEATPGRATATLLVTSDPTIDAEIQFETSLPADGATAEPGSTVAFRAVMRRVANRSLETVVAVSLVAEGSETVPDSSGIAATVRMAPGISTTTVQLTLTVPADAPPGSLRWRLRGVYGTDVELGAVRTIVVPAPPGPDPEPVPAPTPTPDPMPAPAPAPGPSAEGAAASAPAPIGPVGVAVPLAPVAAPATPPASTGSDHTPPAVSVHLFTTTRVTAPSAARMAIPLGVTCPRSERACTVDARITWRARSGRRLTLARATVTLRGGATARLTLRLTPLGRVLLTRRKFLRAVLVVDARDPAGNRSSGEQAMTVRIVAPHGRAPG